MTHPALSPSTLIRKANAHRSAMLGMAVNERLGYMREVAARSDVVVGIFPDVEEEDGFALHVIKGEDLMQSRPADQLRIDAVPCTERNQAVVAERTLAVGG